MKSLIMNMNPLHIKFMLGSIATAILTPSIDLLIRFLIPMSSGIAWVFLKPVIEKYRKPVIKKIKTVLQKMKFWKKNR